MRVPIEWLKELISFRASADQLAEMMTMAGLETTVQPNEVLEIDILPNRADCWSVRGIAREVSALTKFKVHKAKAKVKETGRSIKDAVKVEVRDKDLCPRYMARVIENVKLGESPEWLKKRLELAGMRAINNVVDVTNYLMLELGQPMHAFDANLVKDKFIIVRRANPGEKVVTLDGKEHELPSDVLVIADPDKTIAVAGTMGCANTEVTNATKTVILESAYFNSVSVNRTSKLLKTRTESSVRFAYGVDWEAVEEALDRGAALIAELGRGDVLKGKIDSIGQAMKPKVIELRPERVNAILGADITEGDMISILKRLGFEVKKAEGKKLKVEIPLFRAMDIEREIDLVEEIARIWGFNRIEPTLPNTSFPGKEVERFDPFLAKVREILTGEGLDEVQSYSLIGPRELAQIGYPADQTVKVSNPLTVEQSVLRPLLLPGMLNVLKHNQNRQVENVMIFEIGRVFKPSKEKLPLEGWRVTGLLCGRPFMSALDKGEVDYFFVKGVVENLLAGLGIEMPAIAPSEHALLQPGKGAELAGIGQFGALHPDIARRAELTKPVFFFAFDLDALFKLKPAEARYQPLPKYPAVDRDISMFIPAGVSNQQIVEMVEAIGGELVEAVYPFDKFNESIAYRIIYRHPERTLTEEAVNARHQLVIKELTSTLNVRIRM
ncbi:MAG: phenylalanine--tRNA ligase subunit beta [Candidatus Margulisiibacteriota bacterium]